MKNLNDIGISDVKRVMADKGYQLFTNGRPNIIGIRTGVKINTYCDRIWVFWNDGDEEEVHFYTVTTNPGLIYLKSPIAGTKGTAILVPGQYIGAWILGLHRGKHLALVQQGGPVAVYRDNNKDGDPDMDPKTIQTGYFGINLHHGSITDTDVVGSYSAGCQVWRYNQPHQELMAEFKKLSQKYQFTKFSYTLLEQKDFQ